MIEILIIPYLIEYNYQFTNKNIDPSSMEGYNNCDHIYSFGEEQNIGLLWLGDYNSAKSRKIHREKGIQTIITAGLGMKVSVSDPIKHKLYPLYDSPS